MEAVSKRGGLTNRAGRIWYNAGSVDNAMACMIHVISSRPFVSTSQDRSAKHALNLCLNTFICFTHHNLTNCNDGSTSTHQVQVHSLVTSVFVWDSFHALWTRMSGVRCIQSRGYRTTCTCSWSTLIEMKMVSWESSQRDNYKYLFFLAFFPLPIPNHVLLHFWNSYSPDRLVDEPNAALNLVVSVVCSVKMGDRLWPADFLSPQIGLVECMVRRLLVHEQFV